MLNTSLDNRTISGLSQMCVQVNSVVHKNITCSQHFPISVTLNHGEILGVIGRNGSGKTTFLKILINNLLPFKGKIVTQGKTAFLGSQNPLKRNLSIETQIQFFSSNYKNFPWPEWLGKKYSNLSAGQQRLVSLWITLNQSADIYIIDEPFIFLDEFSLSKIFEWINNKAAQGNCVIFSHQTLEKLETLKNLHILEF